jgi:hypothetical protein
MHRTLTWLAVTAVVASLTTAPAIAFSGDFRFASIRVGGSDDVDAAGINSSGSLVGTFMDRAGLHGFVRTSKETIIFPTSCRAQTSECVPIPTAINDADLVVGYTGMMDRCGWQWRNRVFVRAAGFELGEPGPGADGPHENASGEIVYNQINHSYSQPYAGSATAPHRVMGLAGDLAAVGGLNDNGDIAGTEPATIGDAIRPAIFIIVGGRIETWSPPDAMSITGGLINNARQVAGAFVDFRKIPHFFLYWRASYRKFEMPGGASSITVSAIDNLGDVIGTFVDGTGSAQRYFYFDGNAVHVFGDYPTTDHLHAGMSGNGNIVLSIGTGAHYRSYRMWYVGGGR